MGIEGAAIATNIGRGTGVLLQLWVLFRGGKHIRVVASQLAGTARSCGTSCAPRWAVSAR